MIQHTIGITVRNHNVDVIFAEHQSDISRLSHLSAVLSVPPVLKFVCPSNLTYFWSVRKIHQVVETRLSRPIPLVVAVRLSVPISGHARRKVSSINLSVCTT